ncbi:DUF4083 family protein [Parageobacillus thermantarcticus]|uniref:DUF4083 family protein n=1 Tax=Parageobacillus thermantarcticus TaxID=186116 RepID=UPI000B875DA5
MMMLRWIGDQSFFNCSCWLFSLLLQVRCFLRVQSLVARKSAASNVERIEKKLDRIIELLEKQNKE